MFFSLHWWSRSTISLAGIRCSVAASLSVAAVAGAPVPLFMYKFFRFSYIVWFLALLSTLSLPSWVFWFASSLLPCSSPLPLPLLALPCHSSSTFSHKINGVLNFLNFFLIFWHIQIAALYLFDLQVRADQMRLYNHPYKFKIAAFVSSLCTSDIAATPIFHERPKHIKIVCHIVQEKLQTGIIGALYIPTQYQLAYIFTKALGKEHFLRLRCKLGFMIFTYQLEGKY